MYKLIALLFLSLTLFGCSKTESNSTSTRAEVKNVALTASVSASYDSPNASLVTDGVTSESNFWAGNIAGDNLIIDLGNLIDVTKITVYVNNAQILMEDSSITLEFSSDGVTWSDKLLESDFDIPCRALSLFSGVIECDMSPRRNNRPGEPHSMMYFKATLNTVDPSDIYFYEIEIDGWVIENI